MYVGGWKWEEEELDSFSQHYGQLHSHLVVSARNWKELRAASPLQEGGPERRSSRPWKEIGNVSDGPESGRGGRWEDLLRSNQNDVNEPHASPTSIM